ncbi:PREDICTED: uncharacterized protein LOC109226238 [Nicotiana attenuata]|uniref:uncharacterized protein LOC109226238 n=1 Tax=Nicotiana attenuata TaxID=49451 RepID=UPI000904DD0C|nr:PREDICTED: uncharacterized protein LOC109226238 [Nicotiana attenuata]
MDEPGSPLNQTMHRDITGSFLCLTVSRPDIVLRVGFCARVQSNPKESYLKAAVRILRYLRETQDLVLYHPSSNGYENHSPPAVLKCCGSNSKLEDLESKSRGPNTLIVEDQVADIFTKALRRKHFEKNRLALGMIKPK